MGDQKATRMDTMRTGSEEEHASGDTEFSEPHAGGKTCLIHHACDNISNDGIGDQSVDAKASPCSLAELWCRLPQQMHAKIISRHMASNDQRAWRAVNKHWCSLVSTSIRSLKPLPRPGLPSSGHKLSRVFPGLRALDLYSVATDVSCGKPFEILTGRGSTWQRRQQRFGQVRERPPLPPSAVAAAECVAELLDGLENLQLETLNVEGAVGLREDALEPLSRLTSLVDLSLGGAEQLTGSGLTALAPLTALRRLSLSGCRGLDAQALKGAIEPIAERLREVVLERCQFAVQSGDDDFASIVASMTNLERLSLRGCRVEDDGLKALRRLRNLRALNLQGLPISSAALRHLEHLTGLEGLNLHGLAIGSSCGMSSLSSLSSLTILNLRWCEDIRDENLQEFMPLPLLRDLSLDRCRGLSLPGIMLCLEHRTLTSLSLARCPAVDDSVVAQLGHLKELRTLDLDGCQSKGFVGSTLESLANIPALTHLNMKGCSNVKDEAFVALAAVSKLRHLDLSWCQQLLGPGLSSLGAIGLENLNLAFCRNFEELPLPLASLQELNVSGCTSLKNATDLSVLTSLTSLSMEEIDVDEVDEWVKAAGRLSGLTALSLSECDDLTGEGLAALTGLSSLSLMSLRGCLMVYDDDIEHLSSLRGLQVLSLEGLVDIWDEGLLYLHGLPCLRRLCLSGCDGLSGGAVRQLAGTLPRLKTLDLTDCCLLEDDAALMAMTYPTAAAPRETSQINNANQLQRGDAAHAAAMNDPMFLEEMLEVVQLR